MTLTACKVTKEGSLAKKGGKNDGIITRALQSSILIFSNNSLRQGRIQSIHSVWELHVLKGL